MRWKCCNFGGGDPTRIARLALPSDRVGEIEKAAGVYAEAKIQELAERKMRSDKPELARQWRLLSKIESLSI